MNKPPRTFMMISFVVALLATMLGLSDHPSLAAESVPVASAGVKVSAGGFEETKVRGHAFGVTGWQIEVAGGRNSSVGIFGPGRVALPKLPSGEQCAFLLGDPSIAWVKLSQDLGTVQAGRRYRLTAHIGRQAAGGDGRADLPPYRIVLRDSTDGSIKASAANPVTPEAGEFKPVTLDYTPTKAHPLRVSFEADSSPKATVLLIDEVAMSLVLTPEQEKAERAQVAHFQDQISPILQQRCVECHNAKKQKGGLRLDTLAWLMRGGDSGLIVKPGDIAGSELIQRITSADADTRMPPKGDALSQAQIAALEKWVQAGAIPLDSPLLVDAAKDSANIDPAFMGGGVGDSEERLINRRSARLSLVAKPPQPPTVQGAVNNDIDRFIVSRWRDAKLASAVQPPAVTDDATFLRRVYLDVIGAAPTLTESRRFLDDTKPDKRARLIDELLARDADYAAHWTTFWLDALASNAAPTFGGVISRGNHLPWIYSSFAKNKPYDVFSAELIDPTMPGFKQPSYIDILGVRYKVGFLRDSEPKEVLQTAADVAQIFLGTGMKCASCHSHFDNDEWPQKRFLAFAGYFSSIDLEQVRCEKRTGVFVPAASPFDQPGIPSVAPTDAHGRLHMAALLLTDPANPRFAKTIVNRLWKRYMGLGLFEPADDFRLDTPASHPELLDWLAYDFMAHGYDLKHTIRLILNSRTYQLRFDAAMQDPFDVLQPKASVRYYRSPASRRLTAEQLLDSITVVTRQKLEDGRRVYRAFEGVPNPLNSALGRPDIRSEVSTGRSGDAAIVQALELLNGARYNALINPDALLATLGDAPEPKAIVKLVYRAALHRDPNANEVKLGAAFLKESSDAKVVTREAVTDMLWAIVTSPAFQYMN